MTHKRGGARVGAGRPASGRSKVQFWIDADEADFLRRMLSERREGINLFETKIPNSMSITELSKRNAPPENSPFFTPTKNESCPKCGSMLIPKISAISKQEYLECIGVNCIFTK